MHPLPEDQPRVQPDSRLRVYVGFKAGSVISTYYKVDGIKTWSQDSAIMLFNRKKIGDSEYTLLEIVAIIELSSIKRFQVKEIKI